MEIERRKNRFFVYDDRREYVATISIASWDEFETTINSLTREYVRKIAQYLAESQIDDYLDFIPFTYLWTLQTGDKEAIGIYETSVLPEVAGYIPIQPGTRWTVAFDTNLKVGKRYEIIENWLDEESPVTYLERREMWVAVHSLFSVSGEMEPRIQEKIYSLYMDFLKEEKNRDIEDTCGSTIEKDFVKLNRERHREKRKEDETGWFLKNWLMRRYSIKEASQKGDRLWVWLTFFMKVAYFGVFVTALLTPGNSSPFLYGLFHNLFLWRFLYLVVPFGLFWLGWKFVGENLSRLIWGSVIGWILVFSSALTDVIHIGYTGTPQILRLNTGGTVLSMLVFLGIVLFIAYQEVKGAHIEGLRIQAGRALGILLIGLYFSLVIGAILTSVVSWYFEAVDSGFNKWYLTVLAVGAPQALTVGIITQLIWESRRITEMVRK